MFEAVKSQLESVSNMLWRDPSEWLDLGKENPPLGRRGTREMQTAPQPKEGRIKAGKTVTRVRAAQGEKSSPPTCHGGKTGYGYYLLFELQL